MWDGWPVPGVPYEDQEKARLLNERKCPWFAGLFQKRFYWFISRILIKSVYFFIESWLRSKLCHIIYHIDRSFQIEPNSFILNEFWDYN